MVTCYKEIDKKMSDWEWATLVGESLWEEMIFELRPGNKPARQGETRAKPSSSLCWRNGNKSGTAGTGKPVGNGSDSLTWDQMGPCRPRWGVEITNVIGSYIRTCWSYWKQKNAIEWWLSHGEWTCVKAVRAVKKLLLLDKLGL